MITFEQVDPRQKWGAAIFRCAFEWTSERELDKIIGPKGFSMLDGLFHMDYLINC